MHKQNPLYITLWCLLAAMWSSSYAVIKVGVANLDPSVLVLGRLVFGTVVIYAVLKLRKMALSRAIGDWISYTITGLLGSALPFLLITHGEQTVDSALASILMGVAPMATLLLAAAVVPEESLTLRVTLGVFGGLCGVVILVGPAALGGIGEELIGQLAIVAATLCYAASTVYIRRFVKRPALEMATGSMIVGTLFMTGVVILSDADIGAIEPTVGSLGTIVYLGLFSTACANLIYFFLVPRLGATRMSQVNFAVPVGGALFGVLLLNEAMTVQRFAALAIIIVSVYLGTTNGRSSTTKTE